ncbi:MAG: DUF349 domain-containing protein, partial [Vicinamibacteria bacterium]|nr:DUF349 domain-containing protein [Vicinamibacteria bacterium]
FEPIARNEEASLRDSERALREARQILDQPGPLPSRQDRESLLARFEAIRRTLYPRVSALRQDDEWRRWANAGVQEELCARAEALAGRDDYEQIARELRDLDAHWKQARHVQKDQGEAVWARFKAARDQARQRCDAFFAEQAEIHAKNLKLKEDLCAQAEALAGAQEFAKTAEQLRALQQQWKQIGPVSKGHNQAIWQRFRKACDAFFERFKKHRAERTAQWAENLAKKTALIEQAEALVASIEWERAASEIKRLQAEWKAIGPVRKSQSEPIWQRFRTASDAFFERYKHRDSLEREARLKQRQALVGELEALVPADGSAAIAPDGLAQKVAELQAAWRQCGPLPKEGGVELNQRMTDAVRRLIEIFPQSFAGTDLDPEATRRKMERLCARVEALIAELLPAGAESGDLAQQLKNALAANTMGGKAEREVRFKAAVQEVENAQAAWKRLGPVPAALARTLEERFESACARFFAQRHKPSHKA